ncbi:hypothetical protein FIBSPDRAFT_1042723 [Athelia psychrophila]|uniref:Uncharacterized protein n=1 Tax=Athelia psychrophila TaxID=1759441 RepID=A0A166M202_9AGAM|nr:hypothetical protein FIBSPDRAFT_1042723 [Fibularhizoctonia sp. CBS 109695]
MFPVRKAYVPIAGQSRSGRTTFLNFEINEARPSWQWAPNFKGILAFSAIKRGISDETELTHAPTAPKDGEAIARTLGIGCARCTGRLSEGCLAFSKRSLLHLLLTVAREPGQSIRTCRTNVQNILLATANVLQIICLNRDFKVFDSTLAMLLSYDVHAATGSPGASHSAFELYSTLYKSWALCLFFLSALALASGVVLIYEKPEPALASATVRPRGTGREATASDAHALVHEEVRYTKGEEG